MCGYRINPDTALRAGVVSQRDYNANFASNPLLSWCEKLGKWISDLNSCAAWISWTEYEGEKKYL